MKRRMAFKLSGVSILLNMLPIRINAIEECFGLNACINNSNSVFILKTDMKTKYENNNKYRTAKNLAKEIIVSSSKEYKNSMKVIIKPNWTKTHLLNECIDPRILGVQTDMQFLDGWINGMKSVGLKSFYIRECSQPSVWNSTGYSDWAKRNKINLQDLSSKPIWERKDDEINFVKVPNGVVYKEIGFMSPVNEPGSFLVNIAKLKSHGMGITASVKNLQGTCTHTFHLFCTPYDQVRTSCDKRYHKFFKDDFEKNIESLYVKHVAQKIPRWDRPGPDGGIWMEQWANRMLDALSVTKPGINIVEGIYAHEGDGLGGGPDGKGRDIMANIVIFGLDPLRVDIIAHWIAGHEPGNFGLFHLAIQRGMLDVLDPHDIPLYQWENGKATRIELESIKRVPLLTYYLARDYGKGHEPKYHLVDEECDYAMWKDFYSLT